MFNSEEEKTILNKDQQWQEVLKEGEASTPVSPVYGMVSALEKRVLIWLEQQGIERGSPSCKKEVYFKGETKAESSNSLIDFSLTSSDLFRRRSEFKIQDKTKSEEKSRFSVQPIKVPWPEEF